MQAKSLRKRFKMPFDEVISLTYCDNAAGLIAFQSERAIEIMGLDGVTVSTIDMAKPVTESLNMEISNDGTRLSAIREGQVDVWDVRSGETIKSLKTGANTRIVVSADAARIAVVSINELEIIDLKGGAGTKLAIPDTHIVDVLFPADPSILVTTVRIIDPKQPMLRGEPNFVAGAIAVWDSATGKELRRIALADAVYFAVMSPDGTQLATSAKSGEVSVWGVK